MTTIEATNAAVKLLKDEADELAMMSTDNQWKALPHRAKVAIQNEINRLREVATTLEAEFGGPEPHLMDALAKIRKVLANASPEDRERYLEHAINLGPNAQGEARAESATSPHQKGN